ncbi:MAG: MFS transporter [Clostridia bacterium]|nr:MFS transporter [Clostridia bacterium]
MKDVNTVFSETDELQFVNSQLHTLVDVDRRVLNRRQTLSYMLFDGSREFNIDKHKDLFNDGVLKIDLDLQAQYNIFAGVWDIVDDFIVGAMVEKTRTRWGKFIPWFGVAGVALAIVSSLYWLLPVLFSPEHVDNFKFLPKFFAFAALDMLLEFWNNTRNVSIEGYLSTVTPYPSDRRRLLAISSYFRIIYSRLPDLTVEFMLDGIKHGIVKSAKYTTDELINRLLIAMGPVTAVFSGLICLWYARIARERVHQKIERPRIRDSLRIVFSHRPVLIYMISNALGSFGTGMSNNDYYRQVLDWTTFDFFSGIPSFFFQPIGFANYNRLASRFSTRSLYMIGQVFAKTYYIPLFAYGMLFKDKKGAYFFQNAYAMLPAAALYEILYATFWGVRTISIDEMRNECNDYLEWKCGCRNEATLAAAGAFLCKIPARINGVMQPLYKKWIGYDQTAYKQQGGKQTLHAQKWIFAMATLIPAFLVLGSMVPMFWFNIDKPMRDKMYRELNERRAATAERIRQEADAEDQR